MGMARGRVIASKVPVDEEARRWLERDYSGMWKSMPATIEALRALRDEKAMRVLTWEGYGGADRGVNVFGVPVWGTLVDMQTANCIMTVYEALNEKNKEMLAEQVARSPGTFMRIVEFCWSQVRAA